MVCGTTAGLMVWHADRDVCTMQPNIARRFGLKIESGAHEVRTDAVLAAIHEGDRQRIVRAGEACLETGEPLDVTFRMRDRRGRDIQAHQVGWCIADDAGRRRSMMIAISVSERAATAGHGAFVRASSIIGLLHHLAVDEGWRDLQHLADVMSQTLTETIRNTECI